MRQPPPPSTLWCTWQLSGNQKPRVRRQLPLFGRTLARTFPLYQDWLPGLSPLRTSLRTDACRECGLGSKQPSPQSCLGGIDRLGDEDPVLVVHGAPTKSEAKQRLPYSSNMGLYIRQRVEKYAPGKAVHYTYAYGCAGAATPKEVAVAIDTCRAYLSADVFRMKPRRIIAMGSQAMQAVFGHYVPADYTRRAWARVLGVPAFPLIDPMMAIRNRFWRRQFDRDLNWALNCEDPPHIKGEGRLLTTREEVADYLSSLKPNLPTTVDVEHEGSLWEDDFVLLCVGMAQDPERPVVIPAGVLSEARAEFTAWLADPSMLKTNQNIKHDRHALFRCFGVDIVGIVSDPMLISRIMEPEAMAGLKALSWTVGYGGYKEAAKDLSDEDEKGASVANLPPDDLHAYNARDAACTLLVHEKQQARLRTAKVKGGPGLASTWSRLVGPAFDALAIVERNGILLSETAVRAYDKWLEAQHQRLTTTLQSFPEVPPGFSPGSNPQKAKLLFEILKLPSRVKTGSGGASVSADALEEIKDAHPIVPVLLELSKIEKQRSTYGLGMLRYISPLDGRVHTTFKLVRTGRLSSSEPNMQNVTRPEVPGDEGEWARGCFVPSPGKLFVQLDYSQQELRAAAMLSGDKKMAAAFESGVDFHTATAAAAYGVPMDQVTKAQRSVGKVLNFAIVFGKSAYGIAKDTGKTPEEAQALLDSLLTTYPDLGKWLRNQVAQAEVDGELWAVWDPPGSRLGWVHRRSAHGIGELGDNKQSERVRKHWANVSKNDPIQWLANCFALASVTEAVRWTEEECPEVKVVMTVHDSILFETPRALVDDVLNAGRRIMLSWPSGVAKLKVDEEVGETWGTMRKLEAGAENWERRLKEKL